MSTDVSEERAGSIFKIGHLLIICPYDLDSTFHWNVMRLHILHDQYRVHKSSLSICILSNLNTFYFPLIHLSEIRLNIFLPSIPWSQFVSNWINWLFGHYTWSCFYLKRRFGDSDSVSVLRSQGTSLSTAAKLVRSLLEDGDRIPSPTHLSIYLYIHPIIYLATYPTIQLSTYTLIYLSIYIPTYLSRYGGTL
jgi:hypothetical protein